MIIRNVGIIRMCTSKWLSTLLLLFAEFSFNIGAKNVLLVVVDDLRPSLGGYGDENAFTSNIDGLIKEGFVFHNAFAQQALCAPSRNSFLTSRRPDTLNLYDFFSYWRTFRGNFTTLPQYFKQNSYETKSVGKVFHPGKSSNFTDDYPLSWSFLPWHPPSEKYKNSPVCYTKDGWFENLICPVRLEEQPGKTLPDIEILAEARNFLDSRNKSCKPFFLAVGFHKPHIPLKFPRKYLVHHPLEKVHLPPFRHYPPGLPVVAWSPWTDIRWRHDIARLNVTFPFQELSDDWVKLIKQSYYASVTYVDDLIGQLLNSLRDLSFHKNTIVVLTSDHGWSLGEHGEWSKYSNFDVALRVPLVMRIPHLTYLVNDNKSSDFQGNNGFQSRELVELVDLFPTIVELAGLPKIPVCPRISTNITLCTEGESLVPLILCEVQQKKQNQYCKKGKFKKRALSQYPRPGIFPTRHPNSDKPKLKEIRVMGYSIRTSNFRYTEWIEWNPVTLKGNWSNVYDTELYDLVHDSDCNLNIAGRNGLENIQKILGSRLRKEFGAVGSTIPEDGCDG